MDDPSLGPVATSIKAIFAAMATGFVSNSGVEPIDALFTRGGMASLLTTIWLVLGALSFAAVMEHAGFLQRLLEPIVALASRRGPLILAVNSSGIGLNVIAGDQYVADVLPARMFRGEFARRGLAPQVLSRAVEDSGTVTSVLVPVEHLRRLHLGRARRLHRRLLPVLLLQPAQPGAGRALRVHRVQGAPGDRPLGGRRTRTCRAETSRTTRRRRPHERPDDHGTRPRAEHRFTLPSAYTILFALIVLMAIATWLIPAGAYQLDKAGAPIPGTYHEVAGHPQRILIDSLTAPINGLYGIENAKGNISYYNNGTLFGAIDVALFIIVIGGFLGVTMRDRRHPGRHRRRW